MANDSHRRDRNADVLLGRRLERLYERFNRPEWIAPDPLAFVYRYTAPADREVVGLVSSSLAYGRVIQIHRSVETVLGWMEPSPSEFLGRHSARSIAARCRGFRHRFTGGDDLAILLGGMKEVIEREGSLGAFYRRCLAEKRGDVAAAADGFARGIDEGRRASSFRLLPSPADGSACKRLHLYLRWMVRRDLVDPGVWEGIPAAGLIVPIDVHMHRVGLRLGFTRRRHADHRTALEITEGFRRLVPPDPVRYDFVLANLGIRGEIDRHLGG